MSEPAPPQQHTQPGILGRGVSQDEGNPDKTKQTARKMANVLCDKATIIFAARKRDFDAAVIEGVHMDGLIQLLPDLVQARQSLEKAAKAVYMASLDADADAALDDDDHDDAHEAAPAATHDAAADAGSSRKRSREDCVLTRTKK